MSQLDKIYNARMEGMSRALEIAKEKGLEELERDIRVRGFLKIQPQMTAKEYDHMINTLAQTIYNNVLTTVLYVLVEKFSFGKKELDTFKNNYEIATKDAYDWNYQSQTYVRMQDYAIYLNEKFDLGIDVDLLAANEDAFQERRQEVESYKKDYVKGIINTLKINDFKDAAVFLENQINGVNDK